MYISNPIIKTKQNIPMPDDGKERERETVTLGEAAKFAAAAVQKAATSLFSEI